MSVAVTVAVTVAGRERHGATRRHMARGHGEHTDLDMWWRGDDNSHVKKPAVKWGSLVEPRSVRGPGPEPRKFGGPNFRYHRRPRTAVLRILLSLLSYLDGRDEHARRVGLAFDDMIIRRGFVYTHDSKFVGLADIDICVEVLFNLSQRTSR